MEGVTRKKQSRVGCFVAWRWRFWSGKENNGIYFIRCQFSIGLDIWTSGQLLDAAGHLEAQEEKGKREHNLPIKLYLLLLQVLAQEQGHHLEDRDSS